jgi:DNA-binding NtrC family response regulator
MAHLLIIDDDPNICEIMTRYAETSGHTSDIANTLKEGLAMGLENPYEIILLDLFFPEGNGLDILPDLLKSPASPEVIIITGAGDARAAEVAFKYGAWDYVKKPFVWDEVSLTIKRALQYHHEKKTNNKTVTLNRAEIIGESPAISNCLEIVTKAAMSDASVLISGETGTGKELFSRAIHKNSRRSSKSFATVDCGALPETLAESTLFGYEKGAFTGAHDRHEGVIRQADGGTLFLDEIGDLPLNIQKSLLRTLQERRLRPLGGKSEVPVDFRLVAATNRNLDRLTRHKQFREDLLFRIRAIEIQLPPLRDRGKDIQEIAIRKIHQLCERYGMMLKGVSPEFLKILEAQSWPGNVRELINVLEYALAASENDPTLFPKHLPPEYRSGYLKLDKVPPIKAHDPESDHILSGDAFPPLSTYRDKMEKAYLQKLLEKAGNDRKKACRISGISQSRLYSLLKKHHLSRFRNS